MKQKIYNVIAIIYGLFMANAGLNKFLNYMPMPENLPESVVKMMGAMMEIEWLMPLIAIAEIVGGVLVIIPKYRAFGANILFPILVGIVIINYYSGSLAMGLVFAAIHGWIMYENWHKYTPMIK